MRSTRIICIFVIAFAPSLLAKEQEFRFDKPDAQTVDLMGEFNHWKGLPMTRQANGTWTIKVSISPGTYGYKFLVDGKQWLFDPSNPKRKTVDGVENSAIEITEDAAKRIVAATAPSISAAPLDVAPHNTGSLSVAPGDVTTFKTALSARQRAAAAADGCPRLLTAKVALAVPQAFDPKIPCFFLDHFARSFSYNVRRGFQQERRRCHQPGN